MVRRGQSGSERGFFTPKPVHVVRPEPDARVEVGALELQQELPVHARLGEEQRRPRLRHAVRHKHGVEVRGGEAGEVELGERHGGRLRCVASLGRNLDVKRHVEPPRRPWRGEGKENAAAVAKG